jgi:hypothetical protein
MEQIFFYFMLFLSYFGLFFFQPFTALIIGCLMFTWIIYRYDFRFLIQIIYVLMTAILYRENTEPENLGKFCAETRKQIIRFFREKKNEEQGGDPLLILEWDDVSLQARNMTRDQVLNGIYK